MIELQKITPNNFEAVLELNVTEAQESFVDDPYHCLAEAYVNLTNKDIPPLLFAITSGYEVIGLAMMEYHKRNDKKFPYEELEHLHETYGDKAIYELSRLIIDEAHQGKGLGKAALAKVIEYLRTFPLGQADAVFLICMTENQAARKLFASAGFEEMALQVFDDEVFARLPLS